MPNPTRIEIDCSTGVETIIELTDEEMAEFEAQAAQAEADRVAREAEAAAKLAAKEAVLTKLGLTDEEVAAFLA
jgi:hypothetical protein